jgi:RNA polymerase sigma-70 factor (ECF subfamily)
MVGAGPNSEGHVQTPVHESLHELYEQLRGIARVQMSSERADHTLQATALVHEAFLRLQKRVTLSREDRTLWLAAAAEEMRRILIDHARARSAVKRGGGRPKSGVDVASLAELVACDEPSRVVALDQAFSRLEGVDARAADVVRLRFYLGLSVDETAEGLSISRRSVLRDWEFARAFLFAAVEEVMAAKGE